MTFPLAHFVARDRADAHKLLLAKALPLKIKGEIRRRLEILPDHRMLISVSADHIITITPHPASPAPQFNTAISPQPDQPAKPRRSKK